MTITTNKSVTKTYYQGKGQGWAVFGAGAFAAATMTVLMVLLLATGITPRSMGNLVADKLATIFPPDIQEFFIQLIGPLGKNLLFYGVLVGQVAAGGGLALLFAWLWPRMENRETVWRNSLIFASAAWLFFVTVGLAVVDGGVAGANLGSDQIIFLLTSFVLFEIFGVALGYFFLKLVTPHREVTESSDESDLLEIGGKPNRRRFVVAASVFFMVALAAGLGVGAFKIKDPNYWTSLGEMEGGDKFTGEITPADTFYNVSKNAIDPTVSENGWTLEINGLVNKTLSFNYTTIRQLPVVNQAHTLTCISNGVGGRLIGNADWKGTRLKDILATAGVKPGVKRLVFTCADGYTDSIDIEKANDPQTLLVWEMNGAPLPSSHGYPVRALIPNIYGMKNAKWIKEITLIDTDFQGYWQKQGWDNLAEIKTESTITYPTEGSQVRSGERTTLRGFAFAGNRGIQKVEVSTDGGKSWQEARLKEGLGTNSWQLWHYDWTPTNPGTSVKAMVRATDKTGTLQTVDKANPFPDGSSGWDIASYQVI